MTSRSGKHDPEALSRLAITSMKRASEGIRILEGWPWEGAVQDAIVVNLRRSGWRVDSAADTRSRKKGKDIVASRPDGTRLWVTCKGYPAGTPRTHPATQARNWFACAVLDLVLWHNEDPSVQIAIGLPECGTYRRLVARASWLTSAAALTYYWVAEDGSVTVV